MERKKKTFSARNWRGSAFQCSPHGAADAGRELCAGCCAGCAGASTSTQHSQTKKFDIDQSQLQFITVSILFTISDISPAMQMYCKANRGRPINESSRDKYSQSSIEVWHGKPQPERQCRSGNVEKKEKETHPSNTSFVLGQYRHKISFTKTLCEMIAAFVRRKGTNRSPNLFWVRVTSSQIPHLRPFPDAFS